MVVRKSIWVTGSIAILLLLSACSKHTSENVTSNLSGPQDPNLKVNPAGYPGRHFTGPVYIPRSSPLGDGTTVYNVTYKDGVTVISRADTMRHLLAIHQDGTYIFDSAADQIAKLKSGSVVLLSGLALRTVDDVQKSGNAYMLKTSPAKITDAIKNGILQGTYKVDFNRMATTPSDFDVDFSGFNYHVKFTPRRDHMEMQATIKFGGSQGAVAYEGVGYISNFVSTIRMQIKDGQLTNLSFLNANFSGQAELKWYAVATEAMRAGTVAKITSWPAELVKSASLSRAAYHVPVLLGAIPFDLRISLGFSFIPAFTSKNSVVEGSKLIKYSGSGGFILANGQARPSGSLNVQVDVAGDDSRVQAPGPVGFTAATEAPRLELAMGWPPALEPVAGSLSFVASYGIVTNGMASSMPCQTNIMAFSVNAGAANSSANTFADWVGPATGVSPSVSLWSKTMKTAGAVGLMCPS
jgi:hypothetical protein